MYADPSHIRDNVIKVRLNDDELALVTALARFNQSQLAAFLRDLVMKEVADMQATEQAHAA
ncbi:hypothetical protein [Coralloluteibacterium thermophilus]|uniref:DUF1778 domain-containing protein n=1 Tax=Coralloluteibacterium thermophilum TaxID=2707049 RepID=A0ABV9NPF7_9GAMM